MNVIRNFRKCNNISQVSLAKHLSVTQGFISQIEKNLCPIPDWVISKLLEPSHGWDTSMFQEVTSQAKDEQPQNDALVNYLKDKVDELTQQLIKAREEITLLKYENAMLANTKMVNDETENR